MRRSALASSGAELDRHPAVRVAAVADPHAVPGRRGARAPAFWMKLHDVVRSGIAPVHDGAWPRAKMAACLAILASGRADHAVRVAP
jgi:hypothetical protein